MIYLPQRSVMKMEESSVIYCVKSHITKFITDRGAKETAELIGIHYRGSPLLKCGLEIPCKVSVSMLETCLNLVLLQKHEQSTEELYLEPKVVVILGSFLFPIQAPQAPNTRVNLKRN